MGRDIFNCLSKRPQEQLLATELMEFSRAKNVWETCNTCPVWHPKLLIGSSVLKSAVCLFTYYLTYLFESQGLIL